MEHAFGLRLAWHLKGHPTMDCFLHMDALCGELPHSRIWITTSQCVFEKLGQSVLLKCINILIFSVLFVKQDPAAIVQVGLNPSLVERWKLFKVDRIEQQNINNKTRERARNCPPETSGLSSTFDRNEDHQDDSKRPTS